MLPSQDNAQQVAIETAKKILASVGLEFSTIGALASDSAVSAPTLSYAAAETIDSRIPHPAVSGYCYIPAPAKCYSSQSSWSNKLNR